MFYFLKSVRSASPSLGCPSQPLDLVFALDSSASIGRENFIRLKSFVSSLSRQFDISRDLTQVGLVAYGKRARTMFGLDTHASSSALQAAIHQTPFRGGSASVGSTLLHIYDDVMTVQKGARPGVRKVVVMLTGGTGVEDAIVPAQQLRNALSLLIVGIGHVQVGSLLRIAGSHNNLLRISSFEELTDNQDLIVERICDGKLFSFFSSELTGCLYIRWLNRTGCLYVRWLQEMPQVPSMVALNNSFLAFWEHSYFPVMAMSRVSRCKRRQGWFGLNSCIEKGRTCWNLPSGWLLKELSASDHPVH